MDYLIKTGDFSLVRNYLRPSNNSRQLIFFKHKCCCFDRYNLLKFMKMVKCLPEFEYFTVFLKNRNFISKIRISKVTEYAALRIKIPTNTAHLKIDLNRTTFRKVPLIDHCVRLVTYITLLSRTRAVR